MPGACETAAVPGHPEQLLNRSVTGREHPESLSEALGRSCHPVVDGDESTGGRERVGEQFVAGPGAAPGDLVGTKCDSQPTKCERVEPAERAEQQLGRHSRGQRFSADADGHEPQQIARGEVFAQRRATDGRTARHLGKSQRPHYRGKLRAAANDDGHSRPPNATAQMLLAKAARDCRPLASRARRLDPRQRHLAIDPGRARETLSAGRRRTDATGYRRGKRAKCRTLPVAGRQRQCDEVGHSEHRSKSTKRVGFATAERVCRNIRIPKRDDGDTARAERTQQSQCGLGRLLQIVNDYKPEGGCALTQVAALDRRDGEPGELGLIESGLRAVGENLGVLLDEVRCSYPLRMPVRAAEAPQLPGSMSYSVARVMSSRNSVRKARSRRTSSPRCSGQVGPVPSSR